MFNCVVETLFKLHLFYLHQSDSEADTEIDAKGCTLLPGVETSLPVMLTQAMQGRCGVAQVAHWMFTAVAQAYGIPKKGAIALGYDANLVLVDLNTYRPDL
jgi:dihydroorotase-like cyclic amidohydrolase